MPLRKVHELTFLWFGLPGPQAKHNIKKTREVTLTLFNLESKTNLKAKASLKRFLGRGKNSGKKRPNLRNFLAAISGAARQFYGRLNFLVLSAGNPSVESVPINSSTLVGVFCVFFFWGGEEMLFLWARGVF